MSTEQEIIKNLSLESRENGVFSAWLASIGRNVSLANRVGKALLCSGNTICEQLDEHAFIELVNSVRRSVGLGKGVMTASLCHMPETLSRSMLKQWLIEDSQWNITEGDWEGLMLHAFQNNRHHLAQDMITVTRLRYGESPVINVLGCLNEEQLDATVTIWSDYRDILVASFCARQSWSGAMRLAEGNQKLETMVLNSVCASIKLNGRKKSWANVLKFMIDRSDAGVGIDDTMNRFKSAARVAFKAVMETPQEDLEEEFDTEELKLMAYQLGMEDLAHHMKRETRRKALEYSLGI